VWAKVSYASAQPASAVGLVPLGCYAGLTENGNAACLGKSWFVTETSRKAPQIGCSTEIVTAGVYRSPRALVLPAISRGSFSDDHAGLRAISPYPERTPYPSYLDNGFPAWLPVTVSFGQPACSEFMRPRAADMPFLRCRRRLPALPSWCVGIPPSTVGQPRDGGRLARRRQ
jgi:hypothetical protein